MGYWSRHAADDQSPLGCRSMASQTRRAAHGRLRRYRFKFFAFSSNFGRARCPPQLPIQHRGQRRELELSVKRSLLPLKRFSGTRREKSESPTRSSRQQCTSRLTRWKDSKLANRVEGARRPILEDETEAQVRKSSRRNSPPASKARPEPPQDGPDLRVVQLERRPTERSGGAATSQKTESVRQKRPPAKPKVRFVGS